MKQPSVMAHNFGKTPKADIQRSTFKRPSGLKTTIDSGTLYPIYCDEVLPGDTFKMNSTAFGRMTTNIVPVMDNAYIDTQFFFVPSRLVWDNWKKFNGERINPTDSTDFLIPQITSGSSGFDRYGMADYFGIPPAIPNLSVNALPFRCYNLIYNEWYRDENLINSLTVNKGDTDNISNYALQKRGKRHDYFTSCLPWPQKGDSVELPLGTTAPVLGNGKSLGLTDGLSDNSLYYSSATVQHLSGASPSGQALGPATGSVGWTNGRTVGVSTDETKSGLVANLSTATSATINAIREAFQLQRLLERDARGGTRYIEMIKSHFNVTSPDARLQRPEFLCSATGAINLQVVPQTSSSDVVTPQGNLSAYGTLQNQAHFHKSFTEHGFIIGLASVRCDLTYQKGIDKMWSRKTRYDHYLPVLAHLGEQEVLNKEIYAQGTSADDQVFGYQERWAEYRYKNSQITGKMRSDDPQSLDVYHYSQDFKSLPTLNKTFIEEAPPIKRSLAVQDEPEFLLDCYFDCECTRPMPLYSVPGQIDHF